MISDEAIYLAYPRHVGKVYALKSIAKAVKSLGGGDQARRQIYDAVVRFAASPAGQRGIFTPHCSTWMNQGRYLDDPQEWFRQAEVPVSREPGIYSGPKMSDEDVEELRRRVM